MDGYSTHTMNRTEHGGNPLTEIWEEPNMMTSNESMPFSLESEYVQPQPQSNHYPNQQQYMNPEQSSLRMIFHDKKR